TAAATGGRGRGGAGAGGGEVPSPDGARVAYVRSSGRSELWVRPASGGEPTRLATEDAPIGGVSWSPDGAYVLFTVGASKVRHEQTPPYSGVKIIYTITENVPGQSFAVSRQAAAGEKVLLPPGGFGLRRWLDARHYVFDRTSADFKRRTTSVVDV